MVAATFSVMRGVVLARLRVVCCSEVGSVRLHQDLGDARILRGAFELGGELAHADQGGLDLVGHLVARDETAGDAFATIDLASDVWRPSSGLLESGPSILRTTLAAEFSVCSSGPAGSTARWATR